MVFSSPVFLFLFLPFVLAGYFLVRIELRNPLLLLASLLFYAWGEPKYVAVMLASVLVNYLLGLWVDRTDAVSGRKALIVTAVALNLGLLAYYKYAGFLIANLNALLGWAHQPQVPVPAVDLPLGISFFTFHALSYVIDVYRRQAPAQKNIFLTALYISFFPQLIAGPIVRYHEISNQLRSRVVLLEDLAIGVRRFTLGLGKKILIANTLAITADAIFKLGPSELTTRVAWLGVTCYALQIYFDFSGYSDMAIGLARLFGFHFPENFNYPYTARSMTDFWRRWHQSLSRWFRDYLYVPLGGNRGSPARTYLNLMVVFFLCGLWHGASWNFVIWGLLHGFFLVVERVLPSRPLSPAVRSLGHLYVLVAVLIAWVFFRANTLPEALAFLKAMFGAGAAAASAHRYLDTETVMALVAGALGSWPLLPLLDKLRERLRSPVSQLGLSLCGTGALACIFLACAMRLSAGTYNPFIYFRF